MYMYINTDAALRGPSSDLSGIIFVSVSDIHYPACT